MMPLEDLLVVDFSQFLSGPSASLRLADMGAEVIKIEKSGTGDICRTLYVSDVRMGEESTIFHAINRNKKSFEADLKTPEGRAEVMDLVRKADVVIHNFRPGVMKRLGFDYETVRRENPLAVYAEVSGYGAEGPWKELPGQDLLLQSVSGLAWLTNNEGTDPTPMGVAVADIMAGTHLTQGILAALYQRGIHGKGALIQVSMLESILDFQFEVLTCFYNDGHELPVRSSVNNGHAYLSAPYGIYATADGFLALAMGSIPVLEDLLSCPGLEKFRDKTQWFRQRDEIKAILAEHLRTSTTAHWLSILEPADIWCAKVLNYDELTQEPGYRILQMEMKTIASDGLTVTTTRCPVRIDGEILRSEVGAPLLGEHNDWIRRNYLQETAELPLQN